MQDRTDFTMLYRIAKYYYEDNLSQSDIAKKEHISRPHVSRLLGKAREHKIVDIHIVLPEEFQLSNMEQKLKESLGLKDAVVVFASQDSKQNDRKIAMNIAIGAAEHIPYWLSGCKNVGIGWGYTMYQTSLQLSHCNNFENLTFFPFVGISGDSNPYLQINTIIDRFAEKLGAKSYYTNIPAMRDKHSKLNSLEKERYLKLVKYWGKADTAIIGLGAPPAVENILISEVSTAYKEIISKSDSLGDILCQYFYSDGSICEFEHGYEQVSYPIHKLKNIQQVICLAGGGHKVDGIIAAAKCHFFQVLVTDSITASEILQKV